MIVVRYVWYYFFWSIVRIGISFFFRKITISGRENIPKNAPVIFGANHENAFMDALLLTTRTPRFTHYLARADVFNNPLLGALLRSFNLLPIYRIRDGYSSLKSNETVFHSCFDALAKRRALMMFPEGIHDIRRVSRKLTKGISRIALGAINAENAPDELYVVPVGINYSDHTKFRSEAHIVYGKAIKVEKVPQEAAALDELRLKINEEMLNCTIGFDADHYELIDGLVFSSENGVDISNPKMSTELGRQFLECYQKSNHDGLDIAIDELRESLEELGVKDVGVINSAKKTSSLLSLILMFPLYLFGLMHNLIPITIIESVLEFKVEDRTFFSSLRFAMGVLLFPLFWALELWWFSSYSYEWWVNTLYFLSLPLSLVSMRKFHRTWSIYWALRKYHRSEELHETVKGSINYINKFKQNC
ncbi:MAG: 1-acyl-sn-glycerol-3-phosphate acyltransferase [Cyclobacteriaceae bacterium]